MNILILSAMEEEIEYLIGHNNVEKIDVINGHDLFVIEASTNTIYILNSGIGKVNSSITTSMMLAKYKIDKLISIGTSGALTDQTHIGDFVVGERLAYHDVDVTVFGYQSGQLPGCEKYFTTTTDLWWGNIIEQFTAVVDAAVLRGDIVTGDQFISSLDRKQFINDNFENGLACEMESTAIIHTALAHGIDVYALRSISDNANGEADVTFNEYLNTVCENYQKLVEIIIR